MRQMSLIVTADSKRESVSNGLGQIILEGDYLCLKAIVLCAPDVMIVLCVLQLYRNSESITMFNYPSSQH